MSHASARRRLTAALRRLDQAEVAKRPIRRVRLLQKAEDAANIAAYEIHSEIARLAGEVLRVHD